MAHRVPGDEQACWWRERQIKRKEQMILDAGPVREGLFRKSKAVDCRVRMFLPFLSDVNVFN